MPFSARTCSMQASARPVVGSAVNFDRIIASRGITFYLIGTAIPVRHISALTAQLSNRLRQVRTALTNQRKYLRQAEVFSLAGPTGFEPAISSVTGRRDRPTSLRALVIAAMNRNITGVIIPRFMPKSNRVGCYGRIKVWGFLSCLIGFR